MNKCSFLGHKNKFIGRVDDCLKIVYDDYKAYKNDKVFVSKYNFKAEYYICSRCGKQKVNYIFMNENKICSLLKKTLTSIYEKNLNPDLYNKYLRLEKLKRITNENSKS